MVTALQDNNNYQNVAVVGAGLVGCFAALGLRKKGYNVSLYDMRSDMRQSEGKGSNARSINLALSDRGLHALSKVDSELAAKILVQAIPMKGRMIHDFSGQKQTSQKYGLYGEAINSINRAFLNVILLNEVENAGVCIFFCHKLINANNLATAKPLLTFETPNDEISCAFDFVVGADGAHSNFRHQIQKSMRMDFLQKYIDMQYIELHIPANIEKDAKSRFYFDPNHLHIWPRHNYMLIALANSDGSFTVTFFSPWKVVESLDSSEKFVTFFQHNFPDAFPLLGEQHLHQAFQNHPRGLLIQINVYPYHHPSGSALLVGDAAHSMVPFYGQGMNCGFEDVAVLLDLIQNQNGDIPMAFQEYTIGRKKDIDAICRLALDNYHEMSSKVTSIWYLMRKKLDEILSTHFNGRYMTWIPLYTMVSFRHDISYSKAIEIEQRQAKVLNVIQYGIATGLALLVGSKAVRQWSQTR